MTTRLQVMPAAAGDDARAADAIRREHEILGGLMRRALPLFLALGLTARYFYRRAHQDIFAAAVAAHERGFDVNPSTICRMLVEQGQLDDVGGPSYVGHLEEGAVTPTEPYAAKLVADTQAFWRSIEARKVLERAITVIKTAPEQLSAHVEALLGQLTELSSDAPQDRNPLLDDVAILDQPSPEYLVDTMFPKGGLWCGYGPSGSGKTYVLNVGLGLSIAAGHPFYGFAVSRGPVIAIHGEGQGNLHNRIGAWKVAHGYSLAEVLGYHVWPDAVNLLDPVAVGQFIAYANAVGPVLVIVDTFARNAPGVDENSARDVGLVVAAADRIRRALGCAVLFLHHTNKTGAGERGSTALRGACDVMLALTPTDDQLILSCEKAKEGQPFAPLSLRIVPVPGGDACVARLASEVLPSHELTDAEGKLLHMLRASFADCGATMTDLEKALPSIAHGTLYRARHVLVDRGLIRLRDKRYFPEVPQGPTVGPT